MSQQSKYGAVEVAEAPAATPRRARGVVLALSLLAGGALFADHQHGRRRRVPVVVERGRLDRLHGPERRRVSRLDGRGPGLRPGGNGRERLDAATPR